MFLTELVMVSYHKSAAAAFAAAAALAVGAACAAIAQGSPAWAGLAAYAVGLRILAYGGRSGRRPVRPVVTAAPADRRTTPVGRKPGFVPA